LFLYLCIFFLNQTKIKFLSLVNARNPNNQHHEGREHNTVYCPGILFVIFKIMNKKSKRQNRKPAKKNHQPKANPSKAYKGEQTYRHRYQAVYHVVAATAGGFVESVNFGVIDDFSVLSAQWAVWRIRNFQVKIMPVTSVGGAYAARPFETIDATPVTPTSLASVMDGGGTLRPANNINPSSIAHLKWVSKQLNSDTYTPTSSTTNSNFGDPGFMLYSEAPGSEFFIEVNINFEFREATQYAMNKSTIKLIMIQPPESDPVEQECFTLLESQPQRRPITPALNIRVNTGLSNPAGTSGILSALSSRYRQG
jgi:hypothetical protein